MRPLVQAPLPQWRNLIAAIFGTTSDEELAAPWLRPGESAFWFSRSAWSLAAIAKWRLRLTEKQVVHVWLPDYFCNATLAPLRDMGAELVFYPVTEQMMPDIHACHRLAQQQPIDLFVLVHYFGQATPAEPFAAFSEQHRAWLIEDAAHVLRPVPGVGEFGDCVLYSPHKHLPIPDGAVMVVRPNGPAQLAQTEVAMRMLDEVRASVISCPDKSNLPPIMWLLKRMAQRLGARARSRQPAFKAEMVPGELVLCHPEMSALAKRLLNPLRSRMQAVSVRREQNTQTWASVLNWIDAECDLMQRQTTTTPYLAGFSAGNADCTEALFNRLAQAGLPVTTWPDLPPEVMNERGAHPIAVNLRHSFLYLPVHQSLTEQQLLTFGKILAESVTTNWQVEPLSREEWETYWKTCSQTNLLQSWQYGAAKQEAEGWLPHRLLISDGGNRPVALVQALTKGRPLLGHVARINRGPLVLNNMPGTRCGLIPLLAINTLLKHARSARWRMIQIAPELSESSHNLTGLRTLGYHRVAGDAWGSGRLALDKDEQALLMGLKGKWRNCLRKGEKLGVAVVRSDDVERNFDALMRSYAELQTQKGFDGTSPALLRAMATQSGDTWQFNLFTAHFDTEEDSNSTLGHLVSIKAGDTVLYLIGSVSEKGRQYQANSVLLWHSILHAKKSGCFWFDVGGIAANTPKGIADFKLGINPELYVLAGEWRRFVL